MSRNSNQSGPPGRPKLYALGVALFFGLSTLLMIRHPVILSIRGVAWLQELLYALLVPGFLVGFMISGNIHAAETWIIITANFLIYYGGAYLIGMIWERRKTKSRRNRHLADGPV